MSALNDSVSIETLRFYLSDIQFLKDGRAVFQAPEKAYLIDHEKKSQLHFSVDSSLHFNSIEFDIGIDSLTNISGALGGDLDPTQGMYWTWQSGYINLKLEGKSNACPARHHMFQFHIGGYLPPYSSLQHIQLHVKKSGSLEICVDLEELLNHVDLRKEYEIMSPGAKAVAFAELYKNIFRIKE